MTLIARNDITVRRSLADSDAAVNPWAGMDGVTTLQYFQGANGAEFLASGNWDGTISVWKIVVPPNGKVKNIPWTQGTYCALFFN